MAEGGSGGVEGNVGNHTGGSPGAGGTTYDFPTAPPGSSINYSYATYTPGTNGTQGTYGAPTAQTTNGNGGNAGNGGNGGLSGSFILSKGLIAPISDIDGTTYHVSSYANNVSVVSGGQPGSAGFAGGGYIGSGVDGNDGTPGNTSLPGYVKVAGTLTVSTPTTPVHAPTSTTHTTPPLVTTWNAQETAQSDSSSQNTQLFVFSTNLLEESVQSPTVSSPNLGLESFAIHLTPNVVSSNSNNSNGTDGYTIGPVTPNVVNNSSSISYAENIVPVTNNTATPVSDIVRANLADVSSAASLMVAPSRPYIASDFKPSQPLNDTYSSIPTEPVQLSTAQSDLQLASVSSQTLSASAIQSDTTYDDLRRLISSQTTPTESIFPKLIEGSVVLNSKQAAVSQNTSTAAFSTPGHNGPGNYLVVATKPSSIETPLGKINFKKGAIAFLSWTEDDLHLYNLAEATPNSVTINNGANKVDLYVGKQAVLTRKTVDSFENANRLGQIAWCASKDEKFSDCTAFSANFSLISAVQNIKPLKQLACSDNHAAKKLTDRILKAASLMNQPQTVDSPDAPSTESGTVAMNAPLKAGNLAYNTTP